MNISRERSCDGKARHPNRTAANAAKAVLVGRMGAGRRDLDVYACMFCSGFHVGHRTYRRRG